MKSIRGTRTAENLMKAFAGESQARMRYTLYAEVAKKEGYVRIAQVFRETARNEEAHATRFFSYLAPEFQGSAVEIRAAYPAGLGTTAENLAFAAAGEHEEWSSLYPLFGDVAEEEGFADIASCFRYVAEAETGHEARFNALREQVLAKSVFEKNEETEWKCEWCGYIHTGKSAPEECPTCRYPQAYFSVRCEAY